MIPMTVTMKGSGDLLNKSHKGIVVDNKDPEHKQRLKVSIPGILTGPKEDLPWCLPQIPAFLGDSDKSSTVFIPEEGTEVVVEFPSKEYDFPYWSLKWAVHEVPEEFKKNYPERYGVKDSTGTYWYMDKKTGEFKFEHCSGFTVTIDKKGNFDMKVPGKYQEVIAKTLLSKVTGDATFDTPNLIGTNEVQDKVRAMSGDRQIYNQHIHQGAHGPTSAPDVTK